MVVGVFKSVFHGHKQSCPLYGQDKIMRHQGDQATTSQAKQAYWQTWWESFKLIVLLFKDHKPIEHKSLINTPKNMFPPPNGSQAKKVLSAKVAKQQNPPV